MSLLTEILTAEDIDELYKCGFAIIPRHEDPFDIPAALIKPDWAYQWFTDGEHPKGWKAVAYQDHPGWFAPPDKQGLVVVQGNRLFRKLKAEVEEFHRKNRQKTVEQLEGWADRFGMFTGGATMLQTDGEEVVRTEITAGKGVEVKTETFERPATKTVELVSHLPRDMIPYIDEVFAERDRISKELFIEGADGRPIFKYPVPEPYGLMVEQFWKAVEDDKGAPWWPTLNATILPYAIANVRKANEEKVNAEPASDGH